MQLRSPLTRAIISKISISIFAVCVSTAIYFKNQFNDMSDVLFTSYHPGIFFLVRKLPGMDPAKGRRTQGTAARQSKDIFQTNFFKRTFVQTQIKCSNEDWKVVLVTWQVYITMLPNKAPKALSTFSSNRCVILIFHGL